MIKRRKPKRAEIKKKLLKKVVFTMTHQKPNIHFYQAFSMTMRHTHTS
jgi:hypothetical protein